MRAPPKTTKASWAPSLNIIIIIFVDLTHSTISACNNFMCFIKARFGSKGNFPCLLHKLSQCLVEKQEALEGHDGNKRRAQVRSDGKEKERKGKVFFYTNPITPFIRFP